MHVPGRKINVTEKRPSCTWPARSQGKSIVVDGEDVVPKVTPCSIRDRFCNRVRSGMEGHTGMPIRSVVINIGIGGSDLGRSWRMSHYAL